MTTFTRQCIAEAIGTFCIVFAGTGAIVINDVTAGQITHVGVAIVFGLVVMAMIYALGELSGAHMNPAVTLGFWAARRFDAKSVVPYIASQLVGALVASLLIKAMYPNHLTLGATLPRGAVTTSLILEAVMSAMLMFIILCVSSGSKEVGIMAGIAVGGVICFEAMFGGPISGASMNPARSIAPAIVSGRVSELWIYLLAPIVGVMMGVGAWGIVKKAEG